MCAQLFIRTNAIGEALGDDLSSNGLGELNFDEFVPMLARMANVKYPPETRGSEPFETTWRSFLGLVFVPRFRNLLRNGKQPSLFGK